MKTSEIIVLCIITGALAVTIYGLISFHCYGVGW